MPTNIRCLTPWGQKQDVGKEEKGNIAPADLELKLFKLLQPLQCIERYYRIHICKNAKSHKGKSVVWKIHINVKNFEKNADCHIGHRAEDLVYNIPR